MRVITNQKASCYAELTKWQHYCVEVACSAVHERASCAGVQDHLPSLTAASFTHQPVFE